ncbi:RsmB/NOP family class I SAM-dependent RNA methyltransferase [Paracoccus shanxieyensis]|uniref:RsmB/NOP family class I SAM-dependent RNA methyltransferase n=1 Tax=Paracoccus shanxieyensis TaxID=2675752 RepID=A0A6L6IZC5_9RHOB|nr:RsmB/NOP family class I SAM-dependent RNA methyltransferase [Paracoccus shanxieyensis]MTH64938.1 RsmB/NOP family class I SAM-dependent RNA methyltransferase [Paracoccus shanxieyensis]MTH88158.1 RsmB/NOP family class I SAM-dependent RNA methyltransferase [Paracoccus shanxieyensis]
MTPAARAAAAIDILDRILGGDPAEAALLRWSRDSRFAGSGDRAAVRDLVFDSLRRLRSRAALGGAMTGRGLLLGLCRDEGTDPAALFSGQGHAPAPLSAAELTAGRQPDGAEALDLPDWLLPVWQDALGKDAAPIALAMRDRAPVWLRVNTLRATPAKAQEALAKDGIETQPASDLPTALRVTEGARRVANSRAYHDGLVELQDLSPQLACAALPEARTVLDYCAGGGGKALALAAKGAQVTAHDIDARRMSDLPARAKRAGAAIRLAQPGQVQGLFDLVVADVPCSGSGTWRRTPDAKWRFDDAALQHLLTVQAQILDRVAAHVAPGGHLAYMTCSLLEGENQRQADAFVQRAGFDPVAMRRFTPLDASDGFFLALMRRR